MKHVVEIAMTMRSYLVHRTNSLVDKVICEELIRRELSFLKPFMNRFPSYAFDYASRIQKARDGYMSGLPANPPHPQILQDGEHRINAQYHMYFESVLSQYQIAVMCRDMFMYVFPIHRDLALVRRLGYTKLKGTKANTYRSLCQTRTVQGIISMFYNEKRKQESQELFLACKGTLLHPIDYKLFDEHMILLYDDATAKLHCKQDHKTSTVLDVARNIRMKEDWGSMPILADALQDAGYEGEEQLKRMRDPASTFSLASGIFRGLGL